MTARARTVAVTLALCLAAFLWEAYAVGTGEVGAWTFSRLVWDLTGNPLFVFAAGILAGHWFMPKARCLLCGFVPYRADSISRAAFDIALERFADLLGRHTRDGAKKAAGFPVWGLMAFILSGCASAPSRTLPVSPDPFAVPDFTPDIRGPLDPIEAEAE